MTTLAATISSHTATLKSIARSNQVDISHDWLYRWKLSAGTPACVVGIIHLQGSEILLLDSLEASVQRVYLDAQFTAALQRGVATV
jgi:hypothetical protein